MNRRGLLSGVASLALAAPAAAVVLTDGQGRGLSDGRLLGAGAGGGGGVTDTLTITSTPGTANTGSTIVLPFSYTGNTPSTPTVAWSGAGGTATVSAFSASGGTGSVTFSTPAIAGSYIATVTGTGANTASAVSGTVVVSVPGALTLHFPDVLYMGRGVNVATGIGDGWVSGATQPIVWSLSGTDGSKFLKSGAGVITDWGAYDNAQTTFNVRVNATSGGVTVFKDITVSNPANTVPVVTLNSNVLWDTDPVFYTGKYVVGGFQLWHGGTTLTLSDRAGGTAIANGLFEVDLGDQVIVVPPAHLTAYGEYPVRMTVNGTYTYDTVLWIKQDTAPLIAFNQTQVAYQSTKIYTVLGTVVASNGPMISALSQQPGSTPGFYIRPDQTIVTTVEPVPLGAATINARATHGALFTDLTFTIDVQAGTILDPSAMTMIIASGLDNYVTGQAIGTPAVTAGMTGTKVWTVENEDDYHDYSFGTGDYRIFAINGSTGAVTAPRQLPATDQGERTAHQVEITAMSGSVRCTRTFSVPVAWRAGGPTYHVGAGMVALHGANGFEKLVDVQPRFVNVGAGPSSSDAGGTIYIHYNADPNYYADDNGPNNAQLRFGWRGPVKLVSADLTGPWPRLGGPVDAAHGGVGGDDKGFFNLADGDIVIDGLDVSYVGQDTAGATNPLAGRSGIRKNGETYGDFTVRNCHLHDSANNIEIGAGAFRAYIKNNILSNGSGMTQGSGNTHNLYAGACTELVFTGNTSMRSAQGHALKTRARKGTVSNNRLYDGERGAASNLIHIPDGGVYIVSNNDVHKGPNAQNPYAIGWGDENQAGAEAWRINTLLLDTNRVSLCTPAGNHFGEATVVNFAGRKSWVDGSVSILTMTTNSVYTAANTNGTIYSTIYGEAGVTPVKNESGTTTLSSAFALSFANPCANSVAIPTIPRPGWMNFIHDGNNDNYMAPFEHKQIDPGNDDLSVSAAASAGTVIGTCAAYGARWFKDASPSDFRINPFSISRTWALVRTPQWDGFTVPWAPLGRYAINSASGVITVAGALPAAGNVDFIKVQVTGSAGDVAEYRFCIRIT